MGCVQGKILPTVPFLWSLAAMMFFETLGSGHIMHWNPSRASSCLFDLGQGDFRGPGPPPRTASIKIQVLTQHCGTQKGCSEAWFLSSRICILLQSSVWTGLGKGCSPAGLGNTILIGGARLEVQVPSRMATKFPSHHSPNETASGNSWA